MSDYPKGGDIASTRAWLDKKGFIGIFNNWEADAILGLPEKKIMVKVPGERGEMLWGFLNTARQTTGSICSHSSFSPQGLTRYHHFHRSHLALMSFPVGYHLVFSNVVNHALIYFVVVLQVLRLLRLEVMEQASAILKATTFTTFGAQLLSVMELFAIRRARS
jgi:hypothetical protein